MWQNDFYPTPESIADKFMEFVPVSIYKHNAMILEPSAGKGDLIEALDRAYIKYYSKISKFEISEYRAKEELKQYHKSLHCVEIEPELRDLLKGKNLTIVGSDFMEYFPEIKYTHIIMNPPFSYGADHLLHAWEIVDDGGVVCCILPVNFHERHPKLQNIIDTYAEIVPIGSFMVDDAFRKANVDVAVYILKKPAKEKKSFDFGGMYDTDAERILKGADKLQSEIAIRDVIGNHVQVYEKLLSTFAELADKASEFVHYLKIFNFDKLRYDSDITKHLTAIANAETNDSYRTEYNAFVRDIKAIAWNNIFRLTEANNLMTSKVREDFAKFQNEQKNLAFSKSNIEAFIRNLYFSQNDIKTQCIVDAFDKMTSYDKRNKIHIEGWKTNSFYKVNKKVIMPYGLSTWKFDLDRPHINYSYVEVLNDFDKAMCFIAGMRFENIKSISETIQNAVYFGEDYDSTFFRIRCFKKGTIHLTFLDMDLLAKFNQVAVKDKWNWVGYEEN